MQSAVQKSPEAFRTISEVAVELDVPQHVLRFWEAKFACIRPLKRGGGRRYYRPDDLDLLRGIRLLLYRDGLTIKGVQKILRVSGPRYVMDVGRGGTVLIAVPPSPAKDEPQEPTSNVHPFPRETERGTGLARDERARFEALLNDLVELKARLRKARENVAG